MRKLVAMIGLTLLLVGCSSGPDTVDIDGEALNFAELMDKVRATESDLSEAEQNLKDVENQITSREADLKNLETKYKTEVEGFEEVAALIEDKKSIESEISSAETELSILNKDIETAEGKLEKLNGDIVKASDQPVKLSAGYFYFGEDVEAGRYKLTAQEGHRGNVFIRRDGSSYVSETFSHKPSEYAITEFVFTGLPGDQIEATIPIYLYPVE